MCWAARTFYIFIYLILTIILGNRYYYKPHYTNERKGSMNSFSILLMATQLVNDLAEIWSSVVSSDSLELILTLHKLVVLCFIAS